MCGRVRLSSDYSEIKIKLKFDLDAPAPNFEADWNKPPTAPMLVAIPSVDGKGTSKMMRWGLLPHWAKDENIAYSTFNARAEEFTTKPMFRDAWKRGQRRDGIAVLTWIKWREEGGWMTFCRVEWHVYREVARRFAFAILTPTLWSRSGLFLTVHSQSPNPRGGYALTT